MRSDIKKLMKYKSIVQSDDFRRMSRVHDLIAMAEFYDKYKDILLNRWERSKIINFLYNELSKPPKKAYHQIGIKTINGFLRSKQFNHYFEVDTKIKNGRSQNSLRIKLSDPNKVENVDELRIEYQILVEKINNKIDELKKVEQKEKKILEKELEDIIVDDISIIEDGMVYLKRQYQVDDGIIDILAIDKNNKKCIIELKITTNCKELVYQSLYYPTQFKEEVRMITICPGYRKSIKAALTNAKYVEMMRYYFYDDVIQIEKV